MTRLRTVLLMGWVVCLFTGTVNGRWVQTNGPYGGDILSLAVSPNGAGGTNLFAGTNGGGVFLSTDNGTSWTEVNSGLTDTTVYSFAVSPNGVGGPETMTFLIYLS